MFAVSDACLVGCELKMLPPVEGLITRKSRNTSMGVSAHLKSVYGMESSIEVILIRQGNIVYDSLVRNGNTAFNGDIAIGKAKNQ